MGMEVRLRNGSLENGNNGYAEYTVWKRWVWVTLVAKKSGSMTPDMLSPRMYKMLDGQASLTVEAFDIQDVTVIGRRSWHPRNRRKIPAQSDDTLSDWFLVNAKSTSSWGDTGQVSQYGPCVPQNIQSTRYPTLDRKRSLVLHEWTHLTKSRLLPSFLLPDLFDRYDSVLWTASTWNNIFTFLPTHVSRTG